MGAHRHIDVGLELEIDAEPIAGRIRHGGAASRPFGGWLELAAALEDALSEAHQIPESDAPGTPGRAGPGRRAKDT
jgi:hypothetical protein